MDKDLELALNRIPELMRQREDVMLQREAELDKRERELKRLKESLDEEHHNLGEPGDVLSLNIGGTYISVLRRTLTQVEGSRLATKFSGRWDDTLEKDSEGRFFFDQPAEIFVPLINYLRALASTTPLSVPPSPPKFASDLQSDWYRMVEYYGMTLGVYPIDIYRLESGQVKSLVTGHPDYHIDSDELATFYLVPKYDHRGQQIHTRFVQSFEVALGLHSTAQVGWMDLHQQELFFRHQENGYHGAGYGPNSIAFDCARSGMVCWTGRNGSQYSPVANCTVANGTVIRCENQGESWHFNGNLRVTTTADQNNDVHYFASSRVITTSKTSGDSNVVNVSRASMASSLFTTTSTTSGDSNVVNVSRPQMSRPVPCLTVKGNFRITKIELQF